MAKHKCDGCRYRGEHQEMGFRPFGVCFRERNLAQAEKNYRAEKCPYLATGEGMEEFVSCAVDGMERTGDALAEFMSAVARFNESIAQVLIPTLDAAMKMCKKVCDVVLREYPNKRVIHLAMNHPKARVRKKNLHRITRYIERHGK